MEEEERIHLCGESSGEVRGEGGAAGEEGVLGGLELPLLLVGHGLHQEEEEEGGGGQEVQVVEGGGGAEERGQGQAEGGVWLVQRRRRRRGGT